MKRVSVIFICLLFLLISSTSYIQSSVFQPEAQAPVPQKPMAQMAVVSPVSDARVHGDFFVTGVASDKKEGVKAIDVTFTSMYDKTQTPIRAYTANYAQGKWSTHVKQGELPDDTYAVMVTVHTNEGNNRYLFSTVVVDSALATTTNTL